MMRAFLALAVWGIYLVVVGLPLCLLGVVCPSRRLLSVCAVSWSWLMLRICGVRLAIEGGDYVADAAPRFFVGNHQSALDIPILMLALKGHVRFMAKDSLFRTPIFGWVLGRYGFVPIDRDHARKTLGALETMLTRLSRDPISFAVFPEGTRSPDGRLLPFRQGTMKICRRSGLPVVPFVIEGTWKVHRPRTFRLRPGRVRLRFMRPISADHVAAMSPTELHDRVRDAVVEGLGDLRSQPSAAPSPAVLAGRRLR